MNDQQLQESISDTISALDNKVHDLATASQGRYRMLVEAGATMPAFGEYEPADDEGRDAKCCPLAQQLVQVPDPTAKGE